MEAATGWAWAVTGSHRGSQAWGFSFSQSKRVPAELSETATSCWSSNITSPLYLTALALAICATVFLQMSARLAPALPLYICSNVTLCLKPSMKQEPLSTHTGTHTHTLLMPCFFLYSSFTIWYVNITCLFGCCLFLSLTWVHVSLGFRTWHRSGCLINILND